MDGKEKKSSVLKDDALEKVTGGLRNMHASDVQLKFLQRGECPRCWKKVELAQGGWICPKCKVFFSR